MAKRFIINKTNKSFVFTGYCYGYVKWKTLYLFSSNEMVKISMKIIDIDKKNRGKSVNSTYFYTTSEWKKWNDETAAFKIKMYPEDNYCPDIVVPSVYYMNQFRKFISLHQ